MKECENKNHNKERRKSDYNGLYKTRWIYSICCLYWLTGNPTWYAYTIFQKQRVDNFEKVQKHAQISSDMQPLSTKNLKNEHAIYTKKKLKKKLEGIEKLLN